MNSARETDWCPSIDMPQWYPSIDMPQKFREHFSIKVVLRVDTFMLIANGDRR